MALLFGTCQDFKVGFNFSFETSIKARYSSKKKLILAISRGEQDAPPAILRPHYTLY